MVMDAAAAVRRLHLPSAPWLRLEGRGHATPRHGEEELRIEPQPSVGRCLGVPRSCHALSHPRPRVDPGADSGRQQRPRGPPRQ